MEQAFQKNTKLKKLIFSRKIIKICSTTLVYLTNNANFITIVGVCQGDNR